MKSIFYIFVIVIFILVTFFGLGPVLMADGSVKERTLTLVAVILIYLLLGWITLGYTRKSKKNK